MPAALTWNTPGLIWSGGALWNGVAGSNPAKTKMKAVIDYSNYADGDLPGVAQRIHDMMTANAATFATPAVTMTDLAALISTYNTAFGAKASHATLDTQNFNDARTALEDALGQLGNYVNLKANGDAGIVGQSGCPSYDTVHTPPDTSPPAAPTNLRLKQATLSGSFGVLYKPSRSPSVVLAHWCNNSSLRRALLTLARMSVALAVQTKGLGALL